MDMFGKFLEMMDTLPTEAICPAAEREKSMIEDDLVCHRSFPVSDTLSILSFCRFLYAAKVGEPFSPSVLPYDHIEFYRTIVSRLVSVNHLPAVAIHQFDSLFLRNLSEREVVTA
jgi:hypothetical protein